MPHWFRLLVFVAVASCEQACPSDAGKSCDPRHANCPEGYSCALAEICTRRCELTSDCWVKVEFGCRGPYLPGQRLPDGGAFQEVSEDGFCPETKLLSCVEGYCQLSDCADSGCDYDIYGPSPYKGPHEGAR